MTGKADKTAGNMAILYALQLSPCNPEAAFYTVPHFQLCMVFHDSSFWFQSSCAGLLGWTNPGNKEPKERPVMKDSSQ